LHGVFVIHNMDIFVFGINKLPMLENLYCAITLDRDTIF